jgi:hypothetical protein
MKKCDYEVVYTNRSNNEDERVVLSTDDIVFSISQYVRNRNVSIISVMKIPPKQC